MIPSSREVPNLPSSSPGGAGIYQSSTAMAPGTAVFVVASTTVNRKGISSAWHAIIWRALREDRLLVRSAQGSYSARSMWAQPCARTRHDATTDRTDILRASDGITGDTSRLRIVIACALDAAAHSKVPKESDRTIRRIGPICFVRFVRADLQDADGSARKAVVKSSSCTVHISRGWTLYCCHNSPTAASVSRKHRPRYMPSFGAVVNFTK